LFQKLTLVLRRSGQYDDFAIATMGMAKTINLRAGGLVFDHYLGHISGPVPGPSPGDVTQGGNGTLFSPFPDDG
jgi:hypothetical protein